MSLAGLPRPSPRRHRDEAERPFWISYSDLMTALMVLFLVALTVALMAVTHGISETEKQKESREEDIQQVLQVLQQAARDFPGVSVRGRAIDFGDRARFETNSHRLTDSQAQLLRAFVPRVLAAARDPLGEKWLKRIVVEGFADSRGTYLHNLNLSQQRSQRVLCVLLADTPDALSDGDKQQVRNLFLVSGASFNAQKDSPEESRRIELRLEFLELGEPRPDRRPPLSPEAGSKENRCPLDLLP